MWSPLRRKRPRYLAGRLVEVWMREREEARAAAERRRLVADYQRTHPPDVPRVSGCCDRADQD